MTKPDHRQSLRPVRASAAVVISLAAALGARGASAQTGGCTLTRFSDPPREVLSCADGLSVTAEEAATYRFIDRARDGRPTGAELSGRGLLVDSPPRRGRFQILTPHAIASVRGTVWAVDVSPARTSVFVREGAVGVRRPGGPEVTLRSGDGVDVEAGEGPLAVTRWSARRAATLLARFGR